MRHAIIIAVILWTIQDLPAWERLQRDGVLRADGRRVPPYYRDAYRWMSEQMRLRLPPNPSRFPLWGWYRWQGVSRCRPDLRCAGHLERRVPGVRIEVDLPDSTVLLSDFGAWHCVLNRSFLPLNDSEDDALAAELETEGVDHRWPYPEPFRSRVVSSWQHIFDMDAGDADCWGPSSGRSLQATFWELTLSQVRRFDAFTAR